VVVPLTPTTLEGPLVDAVLNDTYPIWGQGLTPDAYSKWNRAQAETPWGRARFQRVGFVKDGTVLASAKTYDLTARIGSDPVDLVGIGAVFTSPAHRGQGHAHALLDAIADAAARRGCAGVLLFSEIGPHFYARAGFVAVPREVTTLTISSRAGAPAALVRSAEASDLAAISEISTTRARGAAFALDRPADFLAFMLARRRLLAGLGPPGLRSIEFHVTEEAYRAAAYVVLLHRIDGGTRLLDCGDRDPTGARIGAMLVALAARDPSQRLSSVTGWVPSDFHPPQLEIAARSPAPDVMMIKWLNGTKPLEPDAAVFYPEMDQF